MLKNFFAWYKRHYELNLYFVTILFIWQLVHLYWLFMDVIFFRLAEVELWDVGRLGDIAISFLDYIEIPAIILGSVFYITELKKEFSWQSILMLVFLNSQWLHLFWITDEIIVAQFTGTAPVLIPLWLSWMAILIDYLELPVIYDTIKKSISSLRKTA